MTLNLPSLIIRTDSYKTYPKGSGSKPLAPAESIFDLRNN